MSSEVWGELLRQEFPEATDEQVHDLIDTIEARIADSNMAIFQDVVNETNGCELRGWHDSGDNERDENGEAVCEDCGQPVNAVPDCGSPGPDCVEHNGACD